MLPRATTADERIGSTVSRATGLLIGWACFVACVTVLDVVHMTAFFVAIYPLWFTRSVYFLLVIVLLVWLRTVLGSTHRSRLGRSALVCSIVWLFVLPFIPWTAHKALIMDGAGLRSGMITAQVQAIMMTHPSVHYRDGTFCTDSNWGNDACDWDGTVVEVEMNGDHLIGVDINWD